MLRLLSVDLLCSGAGASALETKMRPPNLELGFRASVAKLGVHQGRNVGLPLTWCPIYHSGDSTVAFRIDMA